MQFVELSVGCEIRAVLCTGLLSPRCVRVAVRWVLTPCALFFRSSCTRCLCFLKFRRVEGLIFLVSVQQFSDLDHFLSIQLIWRFFGTIFFFQAKLGSVFLRACSWRVSRLSKSGEVLWSICGRERFCVVLGALLSLKWVLVEQGMWRSFWMSFLFRTLNPILASRCLLDLCFFLQAR